MTVFILKGSLEIYNPSIIPPALQMEHFSLFQLIVLVFMAHYSAPISWQAGVWGRKAQINQLNTSYSKSQTDKFSN